MLNTDITMPTPPFAVDATSIDRALRRQRRSIGRELHDNIGQQLTGLGMLARSMLGSIAADNRDARASVDLLVDGLRRALTDVRSLSHLLADQDETGSSLAELLDRIAQQTRLRTQVACSFARLTDADIEEPRKVRHLARIAQEAIQNALRHAAPNTIRIELLREHDHMQLQIRDDGCGLSSATRSIHGTGMKNMRLRARAIDAALDVRPGEDGGTIVRCKICGVAASAPEALGVVEACCPDLVVVDISLKNGSGLDLVKQLATKDPSLKILVSSMHDENLFAERALRAGARGYINKATAVDRMIEALRKVWSGSIYLSQQMTDRLLQSITQSDLSAGKAPLEQLSDRELEVFELIGQGLTTRAVAEHLGLSVKTVETYRENIKNKLNLENNNELICRAAQWVVR
ncbi:MAG: response regulator [Acidobacteriota bacterium]